MEASGSLGQASSSPGIAVLAPPKPDKNRKKLKLEKKPPATLDIAQLRQQISDHKRKCQQEVKGAYRDNLTELYFLQSGGNLMDLAVWRKKPNVHLNNYLKFYSVDPKESELASKREDQTVKAELVRTLSGPKSMTNIPQKKVSNSNSSQR